MEKSAFVKLFRLRKEPSQRSQFSYQKLSKLENLGIVESRREGKSVYYKIKNKKVIKILEIIKDDEK